MTAYHWIGLMGAGIGLLALVAVIGLVRICLEVEQGAAEERAGADEEEARSDSMSPWGSPT